MSCGPDDEAGADPGIATRTFDHLRFEVRRMAFPGFDQQWYVPMIQTTPAVAEASTHADAYSGAYPADSLVPGRDHNTGCGQF